MSDGSTHIMRVNSTLDEMRQARERLSHPATLDEAITATGIDALFHLLEGGRIVVNGMVGPLYLEIEGER